MQLSAFILIFELLLYALDININVIELMFISTTYAVVLVITYFYVFSKDIRKCVALLYVSLSAALIFGYSLSRPTFRSHLDPYYISLISVTNFIPAFLVVKQSRSFIVPHILIITSLPVSILDPTGYASLALVTPYIVLSNSLGDLIIYAISLISIYMPYLILPFLITNIELIPHVNILNIIYTVPGFELDLIIFFMLMVAIYTLVGYIYVLIKGKFLLKVYGFNDILIRTITSYILCAVAILVVTMSSQNLISVPQSTRYEYLIVAPLTASIFTLLNAFNEMLIKSNELRFKAISAINGLRRDLNLYTSIVERLDDASMRLSISEVMNSLIKTSKELDVINEELSKSLTTPKHINKALIRLDAELRKSLNGIRDVLLNKFTNLVSEVRDIYNSITLASGLWDSHVSDVLKRLEGLNNLEALPDALLELKKALKRLCDLCVNILSTISTCYHEVLGKGIHDVNTSVKCSEDLVMLDVVKIYREFIENVNRECRDEIMTAYNNLIKLSRDLEALINSFKNVGSLDIYTALSNLLSVFKSVPEFGITPVRALFNIREVCTALKINLPKFLEVVNKEVYVRELKISDLVDLKDIKLDYLIKRKSDVSNAVNELLTYVNRPCKELVDYLVSSKLKPLSDLLEYVVLVETTIKRVRYLTLFIKYLDDRLSTEGSINVDEMPLSKDVLNWLLSIYITSRRGVTYDGKVVKREISGTS